MFGQALQNIFKQLVRIDPFQRRNGNDFVKQFLVLPLADLGLHLLFARGLKRLSAAETATLTLAEPLTATLLGVIVLSEQLSAPAGVGAALILSGLLVLAVPARLTGPIRSASAR